MEKDSQSKTDMVAFPVIIHQTKSAYYLKIGNDENKPEDFTITIEEGKLVISSKDGWQKKKLKRKPHSFLHTVKGMQVQPPQTRKKQKATLKSKVNETFKVLKSVLFTM